MDDLKLGTVEARFADIVWEYEPVASGELARICQRELGWARPTTYTVLRKLCEKGLFVNDGGTVRARMSREEFHARRSTRFVTETYGGSLPAFVAAFTAQNGLSREDADRIQALIDKARRESVE